MLQEILEKAAVKTADALISYSISKYEKHAKERQIRHNLIFKRNKTEQAINNHLKFISFWSGPIQLMGMPRPKSLEEIYIELSLSSDIR